MSDEAAFEEEQREIIEALLERPLGPRELEGFRIIYPRFIDRFGGSRLGELRRVFCTDVPEGKRALAASLSVADYLASYEEFAARIPSRSCPRCPLHPLFPILHLASFQPHVYRILNAEVRCVETHQGTGGFRRSLFLRRWFCDNATRPLVRVQQVGDARRHSPRARSCPHGATALRGQHSIPGTCRISPTSPMSDPNDPDTRGLTFHGYFYEAVTQDHDESPVRIQAMPSRSVLTAQPHVQCLEEWNSVTEQWETTWTHLSPTASVVVSMPKLSDSAGNSTLRRRSGPSAAAVASLSRFVGPRKPSL